MPPDSQPITSPDRNFVEQKISELRRRLLDLSARNPLLNYRHPIGSSVRIVDELPDQVANALGNKHSFTLEPVPLPTDKELLKHGYIKIDRESGQEISRTEPKSEAWADIKGIATSYELPFSEAGERHRDYRLQTLLFPPQLESRLRAIRNRADNDISEMGCHTLFLAIGFLKWYESDNSDQERLAPLFTIPVDLSRDRAEAHEGAFRYRVTPRDEDVFDNRTLREKLLNDFALALPSTSAVASPEQYFQRIESAILAHQPRWRIQRSITLATFNFQKQAMYEDLDPARWGNNKSILDHALVRMFFTAVEREAEREADIQEEYSIDDMADALDTYPIVFDADSSQHSAVVDAINGKNLVIEGPPGTGKSQTIANLIAACIAANKSVLFVAEKMAALDVVKSRLTKAGLGDFCLELHGHKAQKSAVLESLNTRILGRYAPPDGAATEKRILIEQRDRLNTHSKLVNTHWANTKWSPHQIFSKAVRYRAALQNPSKLPHLPNINGETYTELNARQLTEKTKQVALLHQRVAAQTPGRALTSHYWCGIRQCSLLQTGHTHLTATLSAWNSALALLSATHANAAKSAGLAHTHEWSAKSILQLAEAASRLPTLSGAERLESILHLSSHLKQCNEALAQHASIHHTWEHLSAIFEDAPLLDPTHASCISSIQVSLQKLGIPNTATLESLSKLSNDMAELENQCHAIADAFADLRPRLPEALHGCLAVSQEGLTAYSQLSELIASLPRDLWQYRDPLFDDPSLDTIIEDLRIRLGELNTLRTQLKDVFKLTALPSAASIQDDIRILRSGGLFRWISSAWRAARNRLMALTLAHPAPNKQALNLAPLLQKYAQGLEEAEALCRAKPRLKSQWHGADTAIERIKQIREWYRSVRQAYGAPFSRRSHVASALFGLDAETAFDLTHNDDGQLAEEARRALSCAEDIGRRVQDSLLQDANSNLIGDHGSLSSALQKLDSILETTLPLVRDHSLSITQLLAYTSALRRQFEAVTAWHEATATHILAQAGYDMRVAYAERRPTESDALRDTIAATTALAAHRVLLDTLASDSSAKCYDALRSLPTSLLGALKQEEAAREAFVSAGDVDLAAWTAHSGETISALINRNNEALQHEGWLTDWLHYLRIKNQLLPDGLADFIRHIEENAVDAAQVANITNAVVFQQLASEILQKTPELAQFYGPEQDVLRQRFQVTDVKVRDMKRQEVATHASKRRVPYGHSGGRVGDYTDRALLQHEIAKQRQHIALRSLLNRAGDAVTALKPCFMMSPMSVATHLEPGRHQFDILIMDEASQIKPEDALGSIARARSLVIVGDPKQLPPTRFFDRSNAEVEDEDEDAVALDDAESILEAVTGLFPTRRLRWHYRSRHESLIEFSAKSFYDNDLVLFPSPFESNAEFGVKFHMVQDGFFQKFNAPEARRVVDFLIEQLSSSPHESVGVVAMNIAQCNLIEEELERRMKEDTGIQSLLESALAQGEPPFIKNLENVQGDERDVIVLSMTYGPLSPGGAVPQRFGPINCNGGWRRLNVLFTRAKKRMHVFSSMRSHNIIADDRPNKGRQALRSFLAYCERTPEASAQESGRAPDSDFEISVMEALEARGHKCTPQLGVAGYFLDVAVRHPRDPGRYLLGVECDGATYHSGKSARDRDRLRQEVLEGLGWKLVRVWSTDWFHNPHSQIQRIENAIQSALQGLADADASK